MCQVAYDAGLNEKILGDFIRKHNVRDKVFGKFKLTRGLWLRPNTDFYMSVASKCGFDVFNDRSVTNSRSHIRSYIDGTIERLGFAPDLYYLHRIDPSMTSSPAYFYSSNEGYRDTSVGVHRCS